MNDRTSESKIRKEPPSRNPTARRIGDLLFSSVHPLYVAKAERKGRTRAEVDAIVTWLTGYDQAGIERCIAGRCDFATFFAEAPAYHPDASKVTGVVCGIRVEEIEDELTRKIRVLDKLVDELAKGRSMEKILRS